MIELDKIYNEDCLEGMKRIDDESIDCIICDLPYEVLNDKNPDAQWDKVIPFDKLWEQYERIVKPNAPIVLRSQRACPSVRPSLSQNGNRVFVP